MDDAVSKNDLSDSQKGISNTTIAVLVILALVVTMIGTLAVMQSGTNVDSSSHVSTNVARVSFEIIPLQKNTGTTLISDNVTS